MQLPNLDDKMDIEIILPNSNLSPFLPKYVHCG